MKIAFLPAALSAALLFAPGCHRPPATDTEAPAAKVEGETLIFAPTSPALAGISVETVSASVATPATLNGRLVWDEDVTVRVFAPFSGRVERVLAQGSQAVAAGDTLALIASPDYAQAQADAAKAESDFALAERTLTRVRALHEVGASAQKDVQSAEADLARATSERDRAAATLRMRGGPSVDGETTFALKSPIAGIVVEKNLNPGQEVRADQMLANAPQFVAPLFVVSDPRRLWVVVDANEHDLAALTLGAALTVRSPAGDGRAFPGKVDWIADSLDPVTRMVRVRGRVENPDRLLKAEMFVTVEFMSPAPTEGVDVTTSAVFIKGEKSFVYVEDGPGKFTRRSVVSGPQHGLKMVIAQGVRPGERVVIGGSLLLDEIRADLGGSE